VGYRDLRARLKQLEGSFGTSHEERLALAILEDPQYRAALEQCEPVLKRIEEALNSTGALPVLSPQEMEVVRDFQEAKFTAIDRHRKRLGLRVVDLCQVYRALSGE